MPKKTLPSGTRRKLIELDAETWTALQMLARDSMKDWQELTNEAFTDLLKKHRRPATLREALRASAGASTDRHPRGKG